MPEPPTDYRLRPSPMLHLFKSAASRAVTHALIGILAVGLLIGAARLVLPFADLFRSELEGVLSETLGLPVRLGSLKLRLAGMVPRLTLRNAELLAPDSGHPQLSLEQLQVDLSLTASLRAMAPKIESLTLMGAQLVIKRLPDGTITLSGLEGLEAGDPEALTFFFGNGRFQVADSDLHWIDEKAGAPPLHLSDVQIHFQNSDQGHRVAILANPFGDPQTKVRLVGDLHGEPDSPTDWNGEIYLHWQGRSLDTVLKGRLPAGLHLGSDSLELESWSRLEGGLVGQSLNWIAAEGLSVSSKSGEEGAAPFRLDRLEGLLRWQRLGDGLGEGWQLQVKDLALSHGGPRPPVSDLGIRFVAAADGGWSIEGGNEYLDLSDAGDLLAQLEQLLPESLGLLGEVHPGGELRDLRLRFLHRAGLPPQWAASGRVEDLRLDAHGRLPGIRGLTAEVAGNESRGRLVLSSDDLVLDFPRLFPNPIRFDETAGEIFWTRDAGGALQIDSWEVVAENADITTRSEFYVSLPADGDSPFLDLQTDFHDGQAASVRRYVPSKRMKEKLAHWLDRAFIEGRIPSGTLLFQGTIADFPFDEGQGRFRVLFDVEDCTLDYHPDWPRLEELAAQVRFENREMEISASKGRFLDSALSDVNLRIPDLRRAVALEIQGRVDGSFADDLRVLGETPLRDKLGVLAKVFEAKGIAHLDLDLSIPLRHKGRKGPLRVTGELTWPEPAALGIPALDIELTDLVGGLRFTEHTLEAELIEAKLWDVPLSFRIETREPAGGPGENTGASTRIQVQGRMPISVLAEQFPSQVWKPLEGQARLELRLDVGSTNMGASVPPLDFELTSDLAGLAVQLPAPLGKPATGSRRLKLSGHLPSEETLKIQGGYGDLGISLGLKRGNDDKLRLARGAFNFGGAAPPLPKGKGLHLGGSLPTLDLPVWLDWWASRDLFAEGSSEGEIGLRAIDVHLGRLQLTDAALKDIRLNIVRGSDRWEAQINAHDLEGRVSVPHRPRGKPIRVALERLDLKGLLGDDGQEDQARGDERRTDPRRAHTLDLSVEQLTWGENLLGQVTLRSQAVSEGLEFKEMSLAGPLMSIQGQGSWKQTEAGPHSSLSFTAKGTDLGEFLRDLEFNSLFYKAPGDLSLDLDWPGGPGQYGAEHLNGRIKLDVGAGSLLEVEPGVGRVLGILNLGALQRRLSLDFSDLFERGYAFEKISGEVEVREGKAIIKELTIEGPAADIRILGSANLVEKELDQVVTVTPRIGTGVAIASAVAGGPLVGAAVFLADRVSGGVVDKLGQHQYVLSGPWAKPEIRRGKLGIDMEQEATAEHSLEDAGRAGAEDPREPKPGQEKARIPEHKQTGGLTRKPASPQDKGGENLFLEGY